METTFLVAGLGNPGSEYERTRHNAGFLVVERLGAKFGAEWKAQQKCRSRVAQVRAGGRKVILGEPQTYMNASGEAVAALAAYYKVPVAAVLVVVDDADLPLGQLRLRGEGSSGGHHGLESIEAHLGTRQFARLRVGIGRNPNRPGVREITGHVLGKFGGEEAELLEKVLERSAAQVECYLADGLPKAMSQFNGAVVAPEKKEEK